MKIEADKQLDGMQWRCKLVMKREVWTGFLHALLFLTLHTTSYPPTSLPDLPLDRRYSNKIALQSVWQCSWTYSL